MKPKTVTVTSSNSPYYIPMDWRGGDIGVTATPSGAGNYDVAYTHEPISSGAASVTDWTDITDMSAATTAQSKVIGPTTCLRITLNSGTSAKIDVTQRDV
jgi:hypothetical protein